ncbi:hypothetical protein D9613_006152 [Agrocybe pediades]|uniref:Uncharacterized protein n=1 Tax=Agrocybe pediades TaxID=84607 RepID=A0A8H4QV43_9AGAR|nr:hypothetical protein D9613_006152 [Agrocybe pediades]
MPAAAKASTSNQPQAATEMKVMAPTPGAAESQQHAQCEHKQQKASRLRGGGAGKNAVFRIDMRQDWVADDFYHYRTASSALSAASCASNVAR